MTARRNSLAQGAQATLAASNTLGEGAMADRRSFLCGLASVPLVGAAVVTGAVAATDPIYAAIEQHRQVNAVYLGAIDKTAHLHKIPEDLEAAADAASDDEIEARCAMHQVTPTTLAGLTAYVNYWLDYLGGDDLIAGDAIPTIAAALQALAMGGAQHG